MRSSSASRARLSALAVAAVLAAAGLVLAPMALRPVDVERRVLVLKDPALGDLWFELTRRTRRAPLLPEHRLRAVFSRRPADVDFDRDRARIAAGAGAGRGAFEIALNPRHDAIVLVGADGAVESLPFRSGPTLAGELFDLALPEADARALGAHPAAVPPAHLRRFLENQEPRLRPFWK